MNHSIRNWWQSRFALCIGIIVLTALFQLKFLGPYRNMKETTKSLGAPAQNLAILPATPKSPHISAAPLTGQMDWHDKSNWRSNLRVGMTQTQVRQLFGEPEKARVTNYLETWNYGSGEIIFADGTIYNWKEPDFSDKHDLD